MSEQLIRAVLPQLEATVYKHIASTFSSKLLVDNVGEPIHHIIARGPFCHDATQIGRTFLKSLGITQVRGEIHGNLENPGTHAFMSFPSEAPEIFTDSDIVIDPVYLQFWPEPQYDDAPHVFVGRRNEIVAQFAGHAVPNIRHMYDPDTLIAELI